MRLDLVTSALPPKIDGIGDYTARLAEELALTEDVRVITSSGFQPDCLHGASIVQAFDSSRRDSVWGISNCVDENPPDCLMLQFNQFCYGKWGLNLQLPRVIQQIKRRHARAKIVLMAHETYVPVDRWQNAVMTVWQRWQLWSLGRSSDLVLFSIEPWSKRYRRWFPGRPVMHLPVGSNIPRIPISKVDARARLGIPYNTVVMGVFGSAHNSRRFDLVNRAVDAAVSAGYDVSVLYIGAEEALVRTLLPKAHVIGGGPFTGDEVSRRLAAVDVYVSAFSDGVSTRRTSFITALQHGLAILGTAGHNTDHPLRTMSGDVFLLSESQSSDEFGAGMLRLLESPGLREQMGTRAIEFFNENYTWPVISQRLLTMVRPLGDSGRT